MRLFECILLPLPKLSATYTFFFPLLKGISSTYMWQEEGELHLTFLRKKLTFTNRYSNQSTERYIQEE